MGTEYERKFLVVGDGWREQAVKSEKIDQAYVAATPDLSIRVRITPARSSLTIKSRDAGASRYELDLEIQPEDAARIAQSAYGIVNKTRHTLSCENAAWTIDVFTGPLEGLVLLEVESDGPVALSPLPSWVGQEVTSDSRYRNEWLATKRGKRDTNS